MFHERLPGSSCAILLALQIPVLDCLWTQRRRKAMGRQRAVPLYKITRGDPWVYHVSVCFRGRFSYIFPFLPFLSFPRDFFEVLVPFFLLFTSLSAIPGNSCWFLSVCGYRNHGRPWAGSGQCLSIKSRGVTPGGTMYLSVLAIFSYSISFPSIPFLDPGLVLDFVDVFHERLPGSSCAILPALYVSFCHSCRFLFWTVCGRRDEGRPWAGSGQCPSIKSRGVTPGGTMFCLFWRPRIDHNSKTTPTLQLLVLLVFFSRISFPSIPFLVPGLVPDLADVLFHERHFLEVFAPFFLLFTSLSAIFGNSCWFWTVCGHRDHGRPWAGSGQCPIKS